MQDLGGVVRDLMRNEQCSYPQIKDNVPFPNDNTETLLTVYIDEVTVSN